MRWEALFDDLENQYSEAERLDLEAEVAERTRVEMVGLELIARLRAVAGGGLSVHLICGDSFSGTLRHVGADALVLVSDRHQVLVPYAAVARYVGLSRVSMPEPSIVRRGLGLASALRGMARDRTELSVVLGNPTGSARITGVLDRVGRDHVDIAVLTAGEVRRSHQVHQVATIPFSALAAIRSRRAEEL